MAFTPIDEQTWERREYLEVFRQTAIYLTLVGEEHHLMHHAVGSIEPTLLLHPCHERSERVDGSFLLCRL